MFALPEDCPIGHYAGREWVLWHDLDDRAPQAQLALEATMLEAVSRRELTAIVRVWRNRHALIVSRQDTHRPAYAAAVSELAGEGTPVLVRDSGGTAVLHGNGIVNFSMAYALSTKQQFSIEATYAHLCRPLIETLNDLGLEAELRSVQGAFCDGRFNLAISGRKITGTAQRIKRAAGREAVLAHASTLIDTDLQMFCGLLERFYRLSGEPRSLPVESITTVRRESLRRCRIELNTTNFERALLARFAHNSPCAGRH